MSRINKNNYESYIIDWMEGALDAQTAEEVMAFLDANPDIKQEVEDYEEIILEPEVTGYSGKSQLKHKEVAAFENITEENYQTFFIARYENDLSKKDESNLKNFLKINPSLQREFDLFSQLTLTKDETVVYPQKASLYHKNRLVPLYWISSAAAVLLLFVALFGLLKTNVDNRILPDNGKAVAQIDKPEKKSLHQKPSGLSTGSQGAVDKKTVSTTKKVPADKHLKKYKKINAASTNTPVKVVREYAVLTPLKASDVNIKLTTDEVYCRFKYKKQYNQNSSVVKPKKDKSLVGKVIAGLFNKVRNKVEPVVPKNNNEPLLARVFDGGAHVLNNYTGTEANVTKYYDNRGNLVAYHFSGGQIKFSKKFNSSGR